MAASEQCQELKIAKQPRDITFRSNKFTSKHAISYASHRPGYPPALISRIIDFHLSTNGDTKVLIDVGCGPGQATRLMAPYFSESVVGVDPGDSMLDAARKLLLSWTAEEVGFTGKVRFEQSTAESLHTVPGIHEGSVDMITAAAAAHWFDLPKFYASAAKVLKPGGTIAIWLATNGHPDPRDPRTQKYGEEVQQHWKQYEDGLIKGGFLNEGNLLCVNNYRDLKLPWTEEDGIENIEDGTTRTRTQDALRHFDEATSARWDFNLDGVPDYEQFPDLPPDTETRGRIVTGNGYLHYSTANLKQFGQILGTASPILRWREAHKEALEKGEIKDYVSETLEKTLEVMRLPPDTNLEEIEVSFGTSVSVILIKKK